MKLIDLSMDRAQPVTRFSSVGTRSVAVGHGHGEAHVYTLYFDPGGAIGPHPTGFAQLFLPIAGRGWIAGADGIRHEIGEGLGAYLDKGELHAKGSDTGMTAVMIQVDAISVD